MKRYLILLSVFLVTGCASMSPIQEERGPSLGAHNSATVGEVLYRYKPAAHTVPQVYGSSKRVVWRTKISGARELIYNGLANGEISVTYREFTVDDYARPAFFQDAQYDYNDDTNIVFKGLKLDVIEADSESITYTVVSGFSDESNSTEYMCKELLEVQKLTTNTISDPSNICN